MGDSMSTLKDAQTAYTFDDFVLVPVYSEIKSRKDPNISSKLAGSNMISPIVSAPMNTVTEEKMAIAMSELGGIAVIHRYMSLERQTGIVKSLLERSIDLENVYFAVSVKTETLLHRVGMLYELGVRNFCVDVANGHNKNCVGAVKIIKNTFSDIKIMAGNVCTFDGALRLAEAGSNSIRVGIGSGAVCTTRVVTGHGLPQLTAIEDCVRVKSSQPIGTQFAGYGPTVFSKSYPDVSIIADGGIRCPADVIKALAVGADAVMIGSMLAGTEETPGKFIEENDRLFKYYSGMASEEARGEWFDKSQAGLPSEGVSIKVPYTGKSAKKIIENLCKSLRVGLSYAGAKDLHELRKNAKWARITSSGYIEGTPHGQKTR